MKNFTYFQIHDDNHDGKDIKSILTDVNHINDNNMVENLCNAPHPYLLGIQLAEQVCTSNSDVRTHLIEKALFCFMRIMNTSKDESEQQCAAIRLVLLIKKEKETDKEAYEYEEEMFCIVEKFHRNYNKELFGCDFINGFSIDGLLLNTLNCITSYCIKRSSSEDMISIIPETNMKVFKKKGDYKFDQDIYLIPQKQIFELFYEFIEKRMANYTELLNN